MTKKALNSLEFAQLSWQLQLQLLHKDGVHVGKREVDHQDVILFQLYGFYVEVYYREYRRELDKIIASENIDILQPYLDQITIHDLDRSNGNEK